MIGDLLLSLVDCGRVVPFGMELVCSWMKVSPKKVFEAVVLKTDS